MATASELDKEVQGYVATVRVLCFPGTRRDTWEGNRMIEPAGQSVAMFNLRNYSTDLMVLGKLLAASEKYCHANLILLLHRNVTFTSPYGVTSQTTMNDIFTAMRNLESRIWFRFIPRGTARSSGCHSASYLEVPNSYPDPEVYPNWSFSWFFSVPVKCRARALNWARNVSFHTFPIHYSFIIPSLEYNELGKVVVAYFKRTHCFLQRGCGKQLRAASDITSCS